MPRFFISGSIPATMTCRPMPVVFQYAPSYRAWNWITSTPASAIMSCSLMATKSLAPLARIRFSTSAKSVSSGWAMSAVNATTVTPFSVSHLVTVQESSPPEAAKATVLPFRSASFMGYSGVTK